MPKNKKEKIEGLEQHKQMLHEKEQKKKEKKTGAANDASPRKIALSF